MFSRKSTVIAVAALFVFAQFVRADFASAHEGQEHDGGKAKTQMTSTSKMGKTCPVTGEKISQDSKTTYAFNGKVYEFCCADCIEKFKKDPEKFIGKAKGKTAKAAGEPIRQNHP